MKKYFWSVALLFAMVMFTSCQEKEATQLVVDDLPCVVTIEGFLKFDPKDKDLASDVQLKDGATIYVDVDVAKLVGSTKPNFVRYSTTTDLNGHFTIDIKTKANTSVDAVVSTSFAADAYGVNTDGKKVLSTALFQAKQNVSVFAGQKTVVTLMATHEGWTEDSEMH